MLTSMKKIDLKVKIYDAKFNNSIDFKRKEIETLRKLISYKGFQIKKNKTNKSPTFSTGPRSASSQRC